MHLETRAIHTARRPDHSSGAIAPAIQLSTTFERQPDGAFASGYSYTRTSNPNRTALESTLQVLEGGQSAFAFASGSAATLAVLQTLQPGDHVLLPQSVYHGTLAICRTILAQWGLQYSQCDQTNLAAVQAAWQPNTRLLWLETPSNPLLQISDIAVLADLASHRRALCLVDNTWATPIWQQPLALGAHLVLHATTKYMGGHSDVLGGAVIIGSTALDIDPDVESKLQNIQTLGGSVPSPFDCWLVGRGLTTLAVRVRAQTASALQVAEFLAQHPAIDAVHYPGLTTHPQHALAVRQMQGGFGAMLSILLRAGAQAAWQLTSHVQLFTRATSLGGVESLIEHRASIEGPHSTTPQNLLRLSIGLEHPIDLIADLTQALAQP